jgi:hypothetical protein
MNNLSDTSNGILQPNISIDLMEHQKKSVWAMLELEKNGYVAMYDFLYYQNEKKNLDIYTTIGILGDKVGAGKTLMIVVLILLSKCPVKRDIFYESNRYMQIKSNNDKYTYSSTNIVVIPNKLLTQWQSTFEYVKDTLKICYVNTEKAITDISDELSNYDVIVVINTMFDKFIMENSKYVWGRIIFDEVDSIGITTRYLNANFMWLMTGTPTGIIKSKKPFIREIFGLSRDWIIDVIIVKNNNEFVDQSLALPMPNRNVVKCKTPYEIAYAKEYIPPHVIQLINAGNSDEAMLLLNCHVDTKENIFQVLKRSIITTIDNKKIELTKEKKKTNVDEHITGRLIRSIKNLETRLDLIITKMKEINKTLCIICLDKLIKPTMVDCCGSIYCFDCFTLTSGKRGKCPTCQRSITNNNMHVIKHKHVDTTNNKEIMPAIKLPDKLETLMQIIQSNKKGKFLVFANFVETFKKIKTKLDNHNISNVMLKGSQTAINKILKSFSDSKTQVIMLTAENFGMGMNLQMTTDIVIYHRFTKEIEEQVIGRAQRLGRINSLNIHYLIHDNEEKSFENACECNNITLDDYLNDM